MSISEIFPPRMIAPVVNAEPLVWPVTEVDIEGLLWVVPLLQKQWPRLTEEACGFWFKNLMRDTRALFVRTENCLGLAEFDKGIKEPMPIVYENFIRGNEGYDIEEPILIERRFLQWAVDLGAIEYRFKLDSDRFGNTTEIRSDFARDKRVLSVSSRTYYAAILKE